MSNEVCWWRICFFPLPPDGQKFFGFAEFLTALALMVLAWTIADTRYRFRIRTATLPLQSITFWIVTSVGVMTLLTDLWRAEGWYVLGGGVISPAEWQALLGGAIFIAFISWVWFAFLQPSTFGKWNSRWYGAEVYRAILRGVPEELAVVADELSRSAGKLIFYARQFDRHANDVQTVAKKKTREDVACDDAVAIMHLLADRNFCKAVVGASSVTAFSLVEEAIKQNKYHVPLGTFMKNITAEALINKESFVYREVAGYYNGYLGYHKPLTSTLYGNHSLVEAMGDVFDIHYEERHKWDSEQWEAFCRLVLITFKSYIVSGSIWNHSTVLFRSFDAIEKSVGHLGNLSALGDDWWRDARVKNLTNAVSFINDAVELLDKKSGDHYAVNLRRRENVARRDVYDLISETMFELIFAASKVAEPKWTCWSIQHNQVWSEFFGEIRGEGPATKIVRHKLRRLLFNEIKKLESFPNFKGASILGLVLNVIWLKVPQKKNSYYALAKATLAWTKRHYGEMASMSPKVAASVLVAGIEYDAMKYRIVRTGMEFLDREPSRESLEIDPPKLYVGHNKSYQAGRRRKKLPQAKFFG